MSSHKYSDQELDTLFQQALHPLAEAEPQRHAWEMVARTLVYAPPRWRWLRSLFKGSNGTFQPFSSQPVCVDGQCVRAPYLDSFSTQVLNLRLAS